MSGSERGGRSETEAAALARLSAARTRLVLERPFLGALILYLPLHAHSRCRSFATDARALYFNPAYVLSLAFPDVQFMLAHQVLHCALGHLIRRGARLRARWDRACDYAVNGLLIDDGMKAPPEAGWNPAYRGLSAEEIYPLLPQTEDGPTLDEHGFGKGEGGGLPQHWADGPPLDPLADEAILEAHRDGLDEVGFRQPTARAANSLAQTWRSRMAASALEAARAGRLAAHWGAVADAALEPRLPWRALLERFLARVARDDYSFARRSRREGEALLPGMESGEANLVVAIDTRGSIPREALERFVEEVDALKAQIRASIALLLCDASLDPGAPLRFLPWERIVLPEGASGGGSTRFAPVFEWVEREPLRPDALLYFTDAEGEFPDRAPDYPVMWLVMGNAPVPFGERVQLN
jgi:predicted metal-dependent peptidase